MKSNTSRILTSPSQMSDFILNLKGGSDELTSEEEERLVKSILGKSPETTHTKISINKFLKKVWVFIEPVVTNQRLWRILNELQKPLKPNLAEALSIPNTRKLSSMEKRVRLNMAKKKNFFSNVNSLGQSECFSPTLTPTTLEGNKVPTAEIFSANEKTGDIQDINIAFEQFQTRMAEIANKYTVGKQKYFLKLLDECSVDRFQALSTEKGLLTIYGVREAETMLQSEFEGYHEQNSITRMTDAEYQLANQLDGRFRKGILSNETNTLNQQYTDLDVKVLVSNKTLQHQANQRRSLENKNPNPLSMYEQGEGTGYSIIFQKSKHCNSNIVERPSSSKNVKHIVNVIELSLEETRIAKKGLIEGSKKGLANQLGVEKESITDKTALRGILFLNENYTIERIN